MRGRISHVIGFDDAPFARTHRGDVGVVGAVYAGTRLEGILSGKVRRDGRNATDTIVKLVSHSRFQHHLQAILLQGVAFAGFNVIDVRALSARLGVAVIVVCRKAPNLAAIRQALLRRVPGGVRKWALIEQLGPMEPAAGVYVQRMGISLDRAVDLIRRFAVNSALPEPLRTEHIVAGGMVMGESRHRA